MDKTVLKKRLTKQLEEWIGEVNYFNIIKLYYRIFNKFVSDDAKKKKFPMEEWEYPYRIKRRGGGKKYYLFRWNILGVGIFDAAKEFIFSAQWAESKGYLPLISYTVGEKGDLEEDNLWESTFLQYGGIPLKEVLQSDSGTIDVGYIGAAKKCVNGINEILCTDIDWKNYYKQSNKLFEKYCKLRPDVEHMYEEKKDRLFAHKGNILGVCIREGFSIADEVQQSIYLKVNPKEPSIEEVIEKAKLCLKEYGCDYIYLSAQFQESIDRFTEEFPEKILYYEREYPSFHAFKKKYQETGDDMRYTMIYESSWKKIQEDYVGTIYCLSKCNSLLGTYSGGCMAALLMNGGNYENVKVFEKREW